MKKHWSFIQKRWALLKIRCIALVSPEDSESTELLLEPNNHPAAKEYQERLFSEGVSVTMFGVADIQGEYERLAKHGVKFTIEPTEADEDTIAVFDDTCGNHIQFKSYRVKNSSKRYLCVKLFCFFTTIV